MFTYAVSGMNQASWPSKLLILSGWSAIRKYLTVSLFAVAMLGFPRRGAQTNANEKARYESEGLTRLKHHD
jgi:hypothetical protein